MMIQEIQAGACVNKNEKRGSTCEDAAKKENCYYCESSQNCNPSR